MPRKLIECHLACAVCTVHRCRLMQSGSGSDVDNPAPISIDHSPDKRPAGQIRADGIDHDRFDPRMRIAIFHKINWAEYARRIDENRWNAEVAFYDSFGPLG